MSAAVAVSCPSCHAQPGQPCTQPTSTSRKPVTWVHTARQDAYAADALPAEPTPTQYAAFGRYVAALLGANAEWDGPADYLEQIAEVGRVKLGEQIGDQDAETLTQWRAIADELGIEHDEEDGE